VADDAADAHGPGVFTADRSVLPALGAWFAPERPGPMMFEHVARTGNGRVLLDRWPAPRVVLVALPGGNYALRGEPSAFEPAGFDDVVGLVEAPPQWRPALRVLDPATGEWPRVVAALPDDVPVPAPAAQVRLLGATDTAALDALTPESAWIHETWGGAAGLAAAGVARAVLVDGRAVSVAVPFYVGGAHEDIGVVTEAGYRGRGLSRACAAALLGDIRGRGRRPSWTTSPDNAASLAVAARLGFVHHRDDVLHAVRVPVPS
jgi:GNAT superfamily N-acetyltransferase